MLGKVLNLVVLGILIQSGVCTANGDDPSRRTTISHGFQFQYFKYPGPSKSGYPLDSDDLDSEKDTHLFIPGDYSVGYLIEIKDYFQLAYKDNGYNFFHLEYTPVDPKPDNESCSDETARNIGYLISGNIKYFKKEKGVSLERIITHGRGALILAHLLKDLGHKPKRIVLLDPPVEVINLPDEIKITTDSADVVETFHTSYNEFFSTETIAHRIFFIGSADGPINNCISLCEEFQSYCNTLMSVYYYFDAFSKGYKGRLCANIEALKDNKCDETKVTKLYNVSPPSSRREESNAMKRAEIYSIIL